MRQHVNRISHFSTGYFNDSKVDMGRWGLPSLDAEGRGNGKKKETPTDEDTSLHPFKTHPMSNPVGAI